MGKIVKIASDTCSPCKQMKTVEEKVLADYKDVTLEVINISTDEGMNKARELGIRSVPTYIFTKSNGLTVNMTMGVMDEDKFKEIVEMIKED